MQRRTIGELLFWCAAALALALYGLTIPNGLPWNESVRIACAYLGEGVGTTPRTGLPHPIWGFYVQVFGGPIALSVALAALAAGLIASLINRYFGWRFALGAAVVWIFLPGVWNRAITGERGVCLSAMAVVAMWVANVIALWVTRKARETRRLTAKGGGCLVETALSGVNREARRAKVNRIAGWVALGAAGLFALVSATMHDYRLGEAASAYARLVVNEAGDRVILLNGVCDEQVVREGRRKMEGGKGAGTLSTSSDSGDRHSSTSATNFNFVSFANTEANRSNIVAWVKREWPAETNLWLEAEIGPAPFVEAAVKAHPERFYSMMGKSTTLKEWEARWEAMKPYLKSQDAFVPTMRRMFAYEGNVLGSKLLKEKAKSKAEAERRNRSTIQNEREKRLSSTPTENFGLLAKDAWNLYYRIFTEIHPKNPAACVNLNMMLRQGYKVDESTRRRIESGQADYAKQMADRQKAKRLAEWISHFGPIMRDQKAYEELSGRVRKQMEELEKKGEKAALIPDLKTLEEWHREMMKSFREREYGKATRIARAILSREAWRGFVPAYMVMGEAMLMKGDDLAAESFLRVAAEATGAAAPPPFVLNDYAHTLRQLGRLDEAETYARRAVKESDEKTGWFCRLTLAEVLSAKARDNHGNGEIGGEIGLLLKSAVKYAPKELRKKIRKENGEYLQ